MRCETCRYWQASWLRVYGSCERCGGLNGYANYPDTKAYATDQDSDKAWFCTMPDFGCTEWAKKE